MELPCNYTCPKCGAADVHRKFYAKGARVPNEEYNVCRNKFASGMNHWFTAYREHIAHHCRCCQYEWQTLPLRKSKSKPIAEVAIELQTEKLYQSHQDCP